LGVGFWPACASGTGGEKEKKKKKKNAHLRKAKYFPGLTICWGGREGEEKKGEKKTHGNPEKKVCVPASGRRQSRKKKRGRERRNFETSPFFPRAPKGGGKKRELRQKKIQTDFFQ